MGARHLRSLNGPRPIRVEVDPHGQPRSIHGRRAVAAVQDRWRLDDEWWREHPISRLYHLLLLDDDSLVVVYRDLGTGDWYEQRA